MKNDSLPQQQEALGLLRQAGEGPDDTIDLTESALALAALDRPGVDVKPYRAHLASLVKQAEAEGKCPTLDDQLRVIRRVLVVHNKYHGDEDHFDDPRNSNLMHVIDRRQGSPAALGVVYLHLARALGWVMEGVDFAGHFFLELRVGDDSVLFDPFRAGQTCSPAFLHDLLVQRDDFAEADEDEIDDDSDDDRPFLYTISPVSLGTRDILLRLQNAIKRRHLGQNKVDAAITTLQRMILLAPRQQDYWRELGYLQAERGSLRAAITALEVVCNLSAEYTSAEQTKDLLRQLRRQLN
jgi:regulator of sirC expression with transglutaminase-like and TPR domain